MRMKGFIATAVAATALVLFSNTAALADFTMIHNSTDEYFPEGGTRITCVTGCSGTIIYGDIGDGIDPDWEIQEKAWHDTGAMHILNPGGGLLDGEVTFVSYLVTNDSFGSNITSFHVPTNGLHPILILAPTDWMGIEVGGFIEWSTGGAGFPGGLNEFIVFYEEHLPIVFAAPTFVDLADGSEITNENWFVSTVPVPGAVLLGMMGLGMVGWLKRKFA